MKTGEWKLVHKTEVFANRWRRLEEWKMQSPDGAIVDFYIQPARDTVSVFGIRDDGQVLVIKEFFPAHLEHVYSLVGGVVDGDDCLAAAERELLEEAGCAAKEIVYLGASFKGKYSEGLSHFCLAKDVKVVDLQHLESGEDITVMFMPFEEFKECLDKNEIQGLAEKACAYRALTHLEKYS